MLMNPLRQSEPVNRTGHFDVAEYDMHDRFRMQQNLHRLIAIDGFNNFVSAVTEVLRDRHPYQNVILDDEDRFLSFACIGHAGKTAAAWCAFLKLTMS